MAASKRKRYRVVYTMVTKWEQIVEADTEEQARDLRGTCLSDEPLDDGMMDEVLSVKEVEE